jgi:hypothetical protein
VSVCRLGRCWRRRPPCSGAMAPQGSRGARRRSALRCARSCRPPRVSKEDLPSRTPPQQQEGLLHFNNTQIHIHCSSLRLPAFCSAGVDRNAGSAGVSPPPAASKRGGGGAAKRAGAGAHSPHRLLAAVRKIAPQFKVPAFASIFATAAGQGSVPVSSCSCTGHLGS